ncbi:hypothetical protein HUT18_22515 [Streptomyces sp. NA04227]|uniref:hypothetical protein n=1 Tax=Streptomyces sp. NA04227 TaxID=2742136 RepID=UPI00159032E2|nr:hypothetical protein [Streptomyces sp. NA04227]QKW08734.1 hypothetical protein HUT18_22515 [Streptomyces sp. NA04227]
MTERAEATEAAEAAETEHAEAVEEEHARVLRICRANWEYRGLDDASVREMMAELSEHLEDAEAAGRTAQDIVGKDVRAFAASWARARAPLHLRALRTSALASFVCGCVALLAFLVHRTTQLDISAQGLTYYLLISTAIALWELRRGSLGFLRTWTLGSVLSLATIGVFLFLGDAVLFTLPLWAAAALILPGVPYAVGDLRARREEPPA